MSLQTCRAKVMAVTWKIAKVKLCCCKGRKDIPSRWVSRDTCHCHSGAHGCCHLTRLPGQEQG